MTPFPRPLARDGEPELTMPAILKSGWKQNLSSHHTGFRLTEATRQMLADRETENCNA